MAMGYSKASWFKASWGFSKTSLGSFQSSLGFS